MITPADLPHLLTAERKKYRRDLATKHGVGSQFFRSMALGQFALSAAENNIYLQRHLDLMIEAMTGNAKPLPGDVRAAADVSSGGDGQVFGVRQGTDVLMLSPMPVGMHEPGTAEWLVNTLKELGIPPYQFWIDGSGIGSSIANIMEQRLGYMGINRFMANNDPTLNFEYADYYTEIHYWLKELLEYRVLRVPFNKDLVEQMRDRLYVVMTAKESRIKTQPKKDYRANHAGKSPDTLDTLVYLFADFNMNAIRTGQMTEPAKKVEKARPMLEEMSKREAEAAAAMLGGGSFSGMMKQPAWTTYSNS